MKPRYLLALGSSATFHLICGIAAVSLFSAAAVRVIRTVEADQAARVFTVAPEDPSHAGLNPIDTVQDDWLRSPSGDSALLLPDLRFDVARIADRATLLFPFLTPGLSLDHFGLTPARPILRRLSNPFASAIGRQGSAVDPPLALGEAALQSLTDTSWSRRDRWSRFQPIRDLAETHSADAGKLPDLLQRYREQNALQPYYDGEIRDPRLWAELGLAADHANFVAFISRFASEHPSTRATTELLFLLDNLTQGSLETLSTLLDTDPEEHLEWTRASNRNAYDLIVRVRRYYAAQLDRRELTSSKALAAYYDNIRLAILNGILRTTPGGYRANDARFLIGAIDWDQRRTQDALESWRGMTVDRTDTHVTAYSQILNAMRAAGALAGGDDRAGEALSRDITHILDNERGRWLMFSYERLRKFGYSFHTF
ncbi:MAG: hypothetical protein LAO77_03695 [Acidobacteriia bacterium]|nr:hypothetical protein [Terriglobia bacterium]